jgi:hypothetical protein
VGQQVVGHGLDREALLDALEAAAAHASPPLRIVDERGHRRRQRRRVVGGDQQHPLRLVGEDLS